MSGAGRAEADGPGAGTGDGPGLPSSWELHGRALRDWLDGARNTFVEVVDDEGEVDRVAVEVFFRGPDELEDWERLALAACKGRVLDLGAGAGCHALALQALGLSVTALEVSQDAVEVMQQRGVRDARRTTSENWANVALHGKAYRPGLSESQAHALAESAAARAASAQRFDTVLLLMHGAGLAGDLDGLETLLAQARAVLAPGGALIVDSRDPGCGAAVAELHIVYQGQRGQPFDWLYLDADTLCDLAREAGFDAERLWHDDGGRHVCRLSVCE